MAIEMTAMVKKELESSDEYALVSRIARRLHQHLNSEEAQALIQQANRPSASSAEVQATFATIAAELGFAIASCKLHGLDAESYLAEIIRIVAYGPRERYRELAPR